jgi:tRNA(Arg) A34 adenosine deaminase TadA
MLRPRPPPRIPITYSKLTEWWRAFDAAYDTTSTDNEAKCSATISLPSKDSVHETQDLAGNTKQLRGHAEMAALDDVARTVNYDADQLRNVLNGAKVTCLAKPCCVQCSIVLGALGIQASPGTNKSDKTMTAGGTWGLTSNLKTCLTTYLNIAGDTSWDLLTNLTQPQVTKYLELTNKRKR